jgi:tetratricopeptide (TPR) repeat protein
MRLSQALLILRRYPEAREVSDKGLTVAPANLPLIGNKAMTFLGEGNLEAARRTILSAAGKVEPTALVADVANELDLVWVLDQEQRALLLRLTPGAFDEDRATWGFCLLQAAALEGNAETVRKYAEITAKTLEERLRATPEEAQRRVVRGLALAYLGRKEEAIREGERAAGLLPVERDAAFGPYIQHQLARIYIVTGEPDKALDRLEPLLKIPYILSPGWLKIDPNFDPLSKNPRFQKLVAAER